MFKWLRKTKQAGDEPTLDTFDKIRRVFLGIAEMMDAFRVVPRLLVLGWGAVVATILYWYIAIESFTKHTCSESILKYLIEKGYTLEQSADVACTIEAIVGGPSTVHTTILSIVVGIAGIVFGFYVNSGRNWKVAPFVPWTQAKPSKEEEPTLDVGVFPVSLYDREGTTKAEGKSPNVVSKPASAGKESVGVHVSEDALDAALPTDTKSVKNS